MPKIATMPVGLWTDGEQWMWNETEKCARVLNGVKRSASANLRYVHEELEEAMRNLHLPLRRCREALKRYGEINARRAYPGWAAQHPEEAAGWDQEQKDVRERWARAIIEAIDATGPLSNTYVNAVKDEK
jgi:hypothetical protein